MPDPFVGTPIQKMIYDECNKVRELLLAKNAEYGNAFAHPIGVFSQLGSEEQIEVRLDDKLKRIQTTRGIKDADLKIHEDTELDLIGYLILLRVARKLNGNDKDS